MRTLEKHIKNFGGVFQGQEDFKACYLASDVDLLLTEALGLVELVFSGSEEDRLQAAQRFREEYGNE